MTGHFTVTEMEEWCMDGTPLLYTDMDKGANGTADLIVWNILLALVRVLLLRHTTEEPVYRIELLEDLARHGYSLGRGALYPILRNRFYIR